MDEAKQSRMKNFEESKFDPTNQKYGLFSYPGTLAVSKNPYFQEKKSKRNKDGSIDYEPTNIISSCAKTGKNRGALFSLPEGKGEPYTTPLTPFKLEKEKSKKIEKIHGQYWKHPGSIPEKLSPFESIPTKPIEEPKKSHKDGVPTGPKNFLTSPMKKGSASVTPGITFSKYPEHLPDPFDLRFLKTKPLKGVKIAEHPSPFKSTDFGLRSFSPDMAIYGGEFNNPPKKRRNNLSTSFAHDMPFKYTSNNPECFSKHPEYMPNPLPKLRRKSPSEAIPWKSTVFGRSTPTPSISYNSKNLRNEFSSLKNF